jgi:hypothetical protein
MPRELSPTYQNEQGESLEPTRHAFAGLLDCRLPSIGTQALLVLCFNPHP